MYRRACECCFQIRNVWVCPSNFFVHTHTLFKYMWHILTPLCTNIRTHTVSHQLNKYRATVKVLCIRWSALPHHQHDYQLHTAVSRQHPRAVSGHDNFTSMHHGRSPFSLSVSRTHTLPPPYAARSKSSSYWTSLIVSPPDLPDILCLPSSPPSLYSPRTNLALGCLFSCLSCSNYSNCAWRGAALTHAWPDGCHIKSSTLIRRSLAPDKKWYLENEKPKTCCNWFDEDCGFFVWSGTLCV